MDAIFAFFMMLIVMGVAAGIASAIPGGVAGSPVEGALGIAAFVLLVVVAAVIDGRR